MMDNETLEPQILRGSSRARPLKALSPPAISSRYFDSLPYG